MRLTQRGDRIMMSSGNTSVSFHNTPNLFFFSCLNPDRNQIRPILWQHNRLIWGFKFSLALGFGGYCWLTSKCPSCPQSSLPSDTLLGAIIPVGLAFQNKGCMFSICSSKEGHIAAGPANTPRLGNQCPIWQLHLRAVPDYLFFLVRFRLRWWTKETRTFFDKLHSLRMLSELVTSLLKEGQRQLRNLRRVWCGYLQENISHMKTLPSVGIDRF